MNVDLEAPFILHPCTKMGCTTLAFGAHCGRHETVDDRAHLHAMDLAVLRAVEAEECWRAARLLVLDAERAAGVRRATAEPQRELGGGRTIEESKVPPRRSNVRGRGPRRMDVNEHHEP